MAPPAGRGKSGDGMSLEARREELRRALEELREAQLTLVLATVDDAGHPRASAAPFVYLDEAYHLFISRLAAHTRHLEHRSRVGVLLLEPESSGRQVFARRRLSLECEREWLERDDPGREPALALFAQRFGGVVDALRGLPDFRLCRLRPLSGSYIEGFGRAYRVIGTEIFPEPLTSG